MDFNDPSIFLCPFVCIYVLKFIETEELQHVYIPQLSISVMLCHNNAPIVVVYLFVKKNFLVNYAKRTKDIQNNFSQ